MNLISDVVILFATVFILDRLIKRHYEKAAKLEEKNKYLNTLGSRHESLAARLETSYVHFVTKVPPEFFKSDEARKKDTKLIEVTNDLKRYVTKDFIKTDYEVIIIDPAQATTAYTANIPFQKFVKLQFKDNILNVTKDYTERYLSFTPKEILESIFKIEDTLNSGVFATPEEHGLKVDISKAEFEPEVMLDKLEKIGNEIIKIKEYS